LINNNWHICNFYSKQILYIKRTKTPNRLIVISDNIKYEDMNKNYNYWTDLYENRKISFNITDNITLNSDGETVTIKFSEYADTKTITISLEECQKAFRKYYNKLSHSNLQELLKNSFC
jgi:hypothetical protein